MEAIWLIIGLTIGAGVPVLAARAWFKDKVAALMQQLATERDAHRQTIQSFAAASDGLLAQVKTACGEAFDGGGKRLTDLVESRLKEVTTEAGANFERKTKKVEELFAPMQKELGRLGNAVNTLEQNRERSHADLSARIKGLVDSTGELRSGADALTRALRQPHTRGRWGELHLRRCVELAGMVKHCDFEEQTPLDDGDGRLRPDMVMNLPGGKHVPIDAKAPVDHYLDAEQATDDETRQAHLQMFARGVRAHMKQLAAKGYWQQFDSAPEFVLMYLPGEHFLSTAAELDPRLIEDAAKECVFITTPTTLMVALRTVAYGWQQERLADDARAVAALGKVLHQRLSQYLGHVQKVGKRLRSTVDAYNDSVGSMEARVLPAARKLPELGVVGEHRALPDVGQVDLQVRSIQAPEADAGLDVTEAETPSAGPAASEKPAGPRLSDDGASGRAA